MNAPDRHHAVCAKHGCRKTGMLMKRPSLRSWRGKPPRRPRSCKMPWMTASRSMHLRRFWDRRVVSRKRWLVTSHIPSATSQPRATVLAGCNRKWSDRQKSDGTSRMETGTDRHHHRSRDEDRRRDRHSSDRDSTRRTSEWLCTEDGSSRKISLFWNFRLGLAGELNIGSHCYSMPYMKIPAINQVVL